MRRHPDHLPSPPAVLTLGALREVQLQLAELASPVSARVDIPLARAAGRVLADDFPAASGDAAPLVARGTRLAARHLPLLAGSGHATASVLARPRIGVMALAGDAADTTPVRERTGAVASAAWVVATLERLGAQPFEATCRHPGPQRFVEKLEMFVGECELVLVLGFLSPALCEAVHEAQLRHGQAARIESLRPRPFGALQVLQVGATLVVALSADLDSAVAAFTTLLTPLVRRLQGRHDTLPEARAAELDVARCRDDERWRLFPVRVDPGALNARVRLAPCRASDAALAFAGADGLAWHAAEFSSFERPTVAFFPFETWAQ
jgi:molybdopterin molybdotransferase